MNKESYYIYYGVQPTVDYSGFAPLSMNTDESLRSPLLEAIYACDPITGLPSGDITCYVSSNTSPEVKKYILDNIMIDLSVAKLPSAPVGLDDDTVASLTRSVGESSFDYASRVSNFMEDQVNYLRQADELARIKESETSAVTD